jgi:transcriptional regulator with XRE-family HTH domain
MYMNAIKDIRTRLGLSQLEMAQLLGTNRSMLAKAETNDRKLDTAALLKLAELEKGVREYCAADTNADLAISYYKKRLRKNTMALTNLEKKQERMHRCFVIGKELTIATMGSEHQKRVERRHLHYGSAARQIGEIKINLLLRENRLLEHAIKGLSFNCTPPQS